MKIIGTIFLTFSLIQCAQSKPFSGETKSIDTKQPETLFGQKITNEPSPSPTVSNPIVTLFEARQYDPQEFKAIDFVANDSLCHEKKGRGRKILLLAFDNTIQTADLIKNLGEVTDMTGVEVQVLEGFATDPANIVQPAKIRDFQGDAIWLLAGGFSLSGAFIRYTQAEEDRRFSIINAIYARHINDDMGLAIFADNAPFTYEANLLLERLDPYKNFAFFGDDPGRGKVGLQGFGSIDFAGAVSHVAKLFTHPITAGLIQNVSEGITISSLQKKYPTTPSLFDSAIPVLINTAGNTSVMAWNDATKKKRIVMHGGYTIFHSNDEWGWMSKLGPATRQFVGNIACWTSGAVL